MAGALVGGPFNRNVSQQINVRSRKRASQNLTDRDIIVQQGNTGWVRVSSGGIIDDDKEAAQRSILQGGVLSQLNKGFSLDNDNSSYTKDEALGLFDHEKVINLWDQYKSGKERTHSQLWAILMASSWAEINM